MSEQIQAGSTVKLKSGGPKMTVEKIGTWNGVTMAWCQWFDGTKPQSEKFAVTSLVAERD